MRAALAFLCKLLEPEPQGRLAGVLGGVGLRPLALQSSPVTDGQQLGPDLMLILGVSVELMRVGGFLNIGVVPGILVHNVSARAAPSFMMMAIEYHTAVIFSVTF